MAPSKKSLSPPQITLKTKFFVRIFRIVRIFREKRDKNFSLCYGMTMSSIWSRQELLELIYEWKAAYKAAATGKSYSIGARTLTRYDLSEIRDQLEWLENELAALDGKRGPFFVHARLRRP